MQARKQNGCRGAVSVYLVLMLAVMIPLTLTMIEAARISTIRLTLECAMDLAEDSVLAEYNRELFRQYDLLMIDTAYEHERGSVGYLAEHLEGYADYTIHPSKRILQPGARDLTGLSADTIEITKVSRATDEDGAVFRYMAVSYMLEKYGIAYVQDIQDLAHTTEAEGIYDSDIDSDLSDAQGNVDAIHVEPPEDECDEDGNPVDWEEPEKDDPAGGVLALRSRGILSLVCKEEISGQTIRPEQYASHRSLVVGDGMCEDWEERNSLAEQFLFSEYIMEKCGCYTTPKENSHLRYEVEYIVAGKDSDTENLRSVAHRLLLLRGGANTVHFMRDTQLKNQAKGMAKFLSFVLAFPEFEELFEILIDAAWIYAESVYDVRLLFDGEKIPLIKEHSDWNLGLENALSLTASELDHPNGKESQKGLSYADYLRLMLYVTPLSDRTARCMDIVEMDIRKIEGYENFRLDDCVAAATVQYIFYSSYGYSFFAERRFRYM